MKNTLLMDVVDSFDAVDVFYVDKLLLQISDWVFHFQIVLLQTILSFLRAHHVLYGVVLLCYEH